MARRFPREEILENLRAQIDAKRPLILFGAGSGLTARSAELGGADIIAVYSTAVYRMRGLPSLLAFLPYSDANDHVKRMATEILPAVHNTPCIAGVGAHDPALNQELFMQGLLDSGFSGFTNEPFAGIYGEEFSSQLESAGIGFSREVELIERAGRLGAFTVAWVFSPEESRRMAEAGADVIGAHVGVTAGGTTGAKKTMDIDDAVRSVTAMCESAKRVNPDIIVLTHGGPFKDPDTAEYSIANTGAVGYAAGSSGERMPTEKAVSDVTAAYKRMNLSSL
jgi:predicted TIM-barrel enzyme